MKRFRRQPTEEQSVEVTAPKKKKKKQPDFDPSVYWYYNEGDYRKYPLIGTKGTWTHLPDGWQ